MNNPKHTKGPWLIETLGPNMFKIESETEPICRLDDFNFSGEHNARLIAAAPDGLAFALRMKSYFNANPDGYDELRELCDAFIAKATGGSNE